MDPRLAATVALATLMSVYAPPRAHAGDYHDVGTLDCSECHLMHYQPEALPAGLQGLQERPGRLLRDDVDELCLSCHDGSSRAADVLGPNTGKHPGDVRQAGHLNRLGGVGSPAQGHTLGSMQTAPGSDPFWRPEDENGAGRGLSCVNCHAPHGSVVLFRSASARARTYRNLRSDAGNNLLGDGLVTYNHERPGVNDLTRDVFVRVGLSYDESAVDFNEPDTRDSAIGRFCAGCHSLFHGSPGSEPIGGFPSGGSFTRFLMHPGAGVDIGAGGGEGSRQELFAARGNRVKVMSSVGVWDPPGADVTPTCVSCHKAHGNRNAFGLIFRSGSGSPTEEGDTGGGTLEDLCGQCHPTRSAWP